MKTIKYLIIMFILGLTVLSCSTDPKDEPTLKDEVPMDTIPTPPPATTTVTDIDGNVYHTIVINGKTWTLENLRVTHYNDGTPIIKVTTATEAKTLTHPTTIGVDPVGCFCWFNNDSTTANKYGALYSWKAVARGTGSANVGSIAPTGWHVATKVEWDELAGIDVTTMTNIKALPGAYFEVINGEGFVSSLYAGYWWTTTLQGLGDPYWAKIKTVPTIGIETFNYHDKANCMSVRLVKNY